MVRNDVSGLHILWQKFKKSHFKKFRNVSNNLIIFENVRLETLRNPRCFMIIIVTLPVGCCKYVTFRASWSFWNLPQWIQLARTTGRQSARVARLPFSLPLARGVIVQNRLRFVKGEGKKVILCLGICLGLLGRAYDYLVCWVHRHMQWSQVRDGFETTRCRNVGSGFSQTWYADMQVIGPLQHPFVPVLGPGLLPQQKISVA